MSTLSDGTILLRPWQPEDIRPCFEAVQESLPELAPWMSWAHPAYSEQDVRSWVDLARRDWMLKLAYQFAITDANSGALLGGCGLSHINRTYGFANLGYWVRTRATGRGVASRAARLLARFGFDQAGLVRVEIVIAVGNVPSQLAAEKCGATREGVLRNRMAVGKKIYDAVMYSLVPQDFDLTPLLP